MLHLKNLALPSVLLISTLFFTPRSFCQEDLVVFENFLRSGFQMGINSQKGETDWLEQHGDDAMKMAYRGNQDWGAVFITRGFPRPDPQKEQRETMDLSSYSHLSVELKADNNGDRIQVGIKDKNALSWQQTPKYEITLSSDWKTYRIPLKYYTDPKWRSEGMQPPNLKLIHIIPDFVFTGEKKRTVYFKNVSFISVAD